MIVLRVIDTLISLGSLYIAFLFFLERRKKSKSANRPDWYVIDGSTELGQIVTNYNAMNSDQRSRMIGYMTALMTIMKES